MKKTINLAVSAQGYGAEEAFDYRAYKTGFTVIKPFTGDEFLNTLALFSSKGYMIRKVKIFSHAYPRGIIMTNWSGFYNAPGPHDTKHAAYISDLSQAIKTGRIILASDVEFTMFGCNMTNEDFSIKLSEAICGVVIAAEGGVYPEIKDGRETGVFISTNRWVKYYNGQIAASNLGKRWRAW